MAKEYKLAHFKAKYGASYRTMANLTNSSIADISEWSQKDTTPQHINDKIDASEIFLRQLIKEGELLGSQAPYIQVIEHEKERLIAENEELKKVIAEFTREKPINGVVINDCLNLNLNRIGGEIKKLEAGRLDDR